MSDEYEVFESDIAIVGMAARLPGAPDVATFWDNLKQGRESIRIYSDEELTDVGELPQNLRASNYVKSGAPLDGMELFDGEFFGFSPKESAIMDPQHRQFLECCWEAFENAGHPPERFEGPIGVFAGCGMGSYFYFNLCTNPELVRDVGMFLLRHTGNDKDFLATRVSYLLDLRGPAVGVQTACSTSLVATHLACQSLLSRECDMALAGGVTIELPHRRGYHFQEGEILSPTGHCHAFDHRAQGTVFGSGAGAVLLRRLEDALDDGDIIHAVIRGSAINNDGSSKVNYLAPSVDGQASCMVEAYGLCETDPRTIEYIECHGTGTYLGDPIEIEALTQAFRSSTKDRGFCRIGSVKTNIGHLDTAAGVASLIKASLALKHAEFPPSLNFEKPNPTIDFAASPFRVSERNEPWPAAADHPRRAAVNSLGVGGTNAHVVLQEAPAAPEPGEAELEYQLLALSARTTSSVEATGRRLAEHLRDHPELSLADVAWTLRYGRRTFARRRVVAARSLEEAAKLLSDADPQRVFTHTAPEKSSLVFLLPGGGAQYPRMAKDLYESEPVFRDEMDRGLTLLADQHGIDLRPLFFETADSQLTSAAETFAEMPNQLPGIFLVSYAMAKVLAHWGVEPDALLGHSLGENTAACLAGVMSFEDCLGLVVLRGELLGKVEDGAMLSIGLPAEEVRKRLDPALDLSVINAPEVTVVSGSPEAIDRFEKKLGEDDEIETRRLAIPVAAHSRMLDPILPEFESYLRSIKLSPPNKPFLSNKTGTWITDTQATDPQYWVSHLRSTVRFADNVGELLKDQARILVECGPGRTLSSLARQHPEFRQAPHNALPTLRHRDQEIDDSAFLLTALGRIWASGGEFDIEKLNPNEERQRVELPTYAWDHKPYFIEPGRVQLQDSTPDLAKIDDIGQWGWEPHWKPTLADPREATERRTWLLFTDTSGVGRRLRQRLQARGDRVVTVYEGDAYLKRSDTEYSLAPERGKEGYAALVRDLVAEGKAPDAVVHAWLLTDEGSFRPGSNLFHHHQERGFFSLFFLAQALGDESVPTPLHINVLMNGLARVQDEPVPYPEKATALGPVKVIPREFEGVSVLALDVQLPIKSDRLFGGALRRALVDPFSLRNRAEERLDNLVDRITEDLLSPPKNGVAALRAERRYELTYESARLAETDRANLLKEGGVYLITGGLGGLGITVADYLARQCNARLVLLSRTPIPERAQWAEWMRQHGSEDRISRRLRRLLDVEDRGGQLLVVSADVTNIEEMRGAVERAEGHFGPIDGVFHTAGVVQDDLIQLKTQEAVEDVFAPKIQGTMVLEQLFKERPLGLMVLFSSTSTVSAPAGQVDYVAANDFLNSFADARAAAPGGRTIAINWGIWNEVGMAATAAPEAPETPIGSTVGEQPNHPLLNARILQSGSETALNKELIADREWVLDGHRTKAGHALLPGTGYIELARAALEAYGESGPFEVEDLFFIRPLAVRDDEPKEMRVRLRPSQRGYWYEVRSRVELDQRVGWELNAQAHLSLAALSEPESIDVTAIEARCQTQILDPDPSGIRTPQENHLRFGPRWRVLQRGQFGTGEAIGRLRLPDKYLEELTEFPLHPALLDIATGWAMNLIRGYAGERLWVPISYERLRFYDALTPEVVSWVRNHGDNHDDSEFVFFDIVLSDPQGRVLLEVDRLSLRKMSGDVDFAVQSRPSPNEVEFETDPASDRELSPGEQTLLSNLERGITVGEGQDALNRVLAGPGRSRVVVSSLDLKGLVRQAESTAASASVSEGIKLARPDLASEYVEPRNEVEKTLVSFWQELLGVDMVGVQDSFFELGGHSLIAVRLFAKVKKAFQVEFPISVLFEAPTIERCAVLIKDAIGPGDAAAAKPEAPRTRYTHLVPMHPGDGGPKTPFFIVAGMFGNVLNLRHLAHLIGTDRRFFGLQARGLYGDQQPHETFVEMAEAYLTEMRTVQPRGPYFLGGFSGGGITAYEMAQQLRAAGEEVALLVMLDTPLPFPPPKLSVRDRALIQVQQIKDKGASYFGEWALNRWNWEVTRLKKRFDEPEPDVTPDEFNNEAIEQAFRGALGRYDLKSWPGHLTLFRPALEIAFDLGNGRLLDHQRDYVFEDNGWTDYVDSLDVFEVPGDHDAMVLEPNVRVLARRLREVIEAAEARMRKSPRELRRAAE